MKISNRKVNKHLLYSRKLWRKLGSCWKPSSRVELHVKFIAEVSFVNRCCQNLCAIKMTVGNPPEVARSDKLRCNRAASCFSIIGTRIFQKFPTVITRITKQILIFRSHIPMVLMEIMVAMCNGSGTRRCEPW